MSGAASSSASAFASASAAAATALLQQQHPQQHRELQAESGGGGDYFANYLLSLVGLELPLTVEQQAFTVSIVGMYALVTVLFFALTILSGCNMCFECTVRCCKGDEDELTFVVLDEKMDIERAEIQALARAEATDGKPRLHRFLNGGGSGGSGTATPTGGSCHFTPIADKAFAPTAAASADTPAAVDTPAARKGVPAPKVQLPGAGGSQSSSPSAAAATPAGASTARVDASPPCYSSRASPLSSRSPSHSADVAFAQFKLRAGQTPREPDYDAFGWRDKDSPAWYGV